MTSDKFSTWLNVHHPKFLSLTDAVVLIMTQLLRDAGIPYLTITGRTKSISDCREKAKRKKYKSPSTQMTDISGVRVIAYFETDVVRISKLIEENFNIDFINSSNKNDTLSVNEVGYRSVHYVCDLGEDRLRLKENIRLRDLKLEFQVRTVLQHAWAELAHDRNYKFSAQLPPALERKLFLLAALMETADNGFGELSKEIDEYSLSVAVLTADGNLDIQINSLSLDEFMMTWAKKNGVKLSQDYVKSGINDLIQELDQFGINTLQDLENIIPADFGGNLAGKTTTILSVVRDWMIIHDHRRLFRDVDIAWSLTETDLSLYRKFLPLDDIEAIENAVEVILDDDSEWPIDEATEREMLDALPTATASRRPS